MHEEEVCATLANATTGGPVQSSVPTSLLAIAILIPAIQVTASVNQVHSLKTTQAGNVIRGEGAGHDLSKHWEEYQGK